MQLKSIKAYGFKSFADKIDIEIKDGITGIVGPNGSGKSNIVDAVRWVLGEQSIKALRGENAMSDVIFQGSASRKPLTRASVALTFDNRDHYLKSDFEELEIKRTVYASGDNEYTINGAKVRLKDITDLFLDTGAGKEAFSIIGQGKIGEILNTKPEERRAIIEEAAGVLKYKKRKIDSLRKLDKTNDNLSKVDLIIDELSVSLEPLREQKEKANKYLTFRKELEQIEISLLINDISNINNEYETLKKKREDLEKEINDISASTSKDDASIEKLKLVLIKLDQDINTKSAKLLEITEEISSLEAEKQVITERKKYEVDDVKLSANIIALKENILELENSASSIKQEIEAQKSNLEAFNKKKDELENEHKKILASKNNLSSEIALKTRLLNETKNKIDILESNIDNDSLVPYPVKQCLSNPRLKGLHGTLGSLIDVEDKYATAIETALLYNQNFIVCDNETSATAAIQFLKDNHLGRATFFPMNIIKPKYVDSDTIAKIKSYPGFIDIAANLVTYDIKYQNIVANQLGNIIVVNSIYDMNKIGKDINYSYRIITIEGDILHTGGSMSGGDKKTSKNIINEKATLSNYKHTLDMLTRELDYNNEKLTKALKDLELNEELINNVSTDLTTTNLIIKTKESTLSTLNDNISSKKKELEGTNNLKAGALDKELDKVLNTYYEKVNEKNSIQEVIDNLKGKKTSTNEELSELELSCKKVNSSLNKLVSDSNQIDVTLGKLDIKMDNLLLRLSDEYAITYERAKMEYTVSPDIEKSRGRVQELKREIRDLGEVNTGAISEFDRINERYTFLTNQREDLKASINDLLGIIDEMDKTMIEEFTKTYNQVNEEFKKVFRELFKGGNGELVLTEPLNMLETGIDIIAEPPGKKLKSISLLSGGEKTLTAIALLFAILNVKTVPFCILDEVEAALDEANVDTFGNYLKDYKNKTQFIVITHKKKTMEYANTLYGVTMQESGVSKLVSVKLDGIK